VNRRLFFRSMVGASGAAALPAKKADPPLLAIGDVACGHCLSTMMFHGSMVDGYPETFLTCESPRCPQFAVAVKVPRIPGEAVSLEGRAHCSCFVCQRNEGRK
jgi:hypothetical protein